METFADFFTGFLAGLGFTMAIMHLIYQKILTKEGWIEKSGREQKFWLTTLLYLTLGVSATLYMAYT